MCSIRIFAKNIGDPYYEPTIVVHDTLRLIMNIDIIYCIALKSNVLAKCLAFTTCDANF